ncbi:MAG: hypothetical protein R3C05_06890 [Pirellulaceae bacterium]
MSRVTFLIGFFALAASGCSSSPGGPETVPVAGVITMGGQAVEGATVQFIGGQFSAFAKTDSSGKFSLEPGAVVGENKVLISKLSMPAGADPTMDEGQLMAMAGDPAMAANKNAPKQLIPGQYSDPEKSTLTFVVPEDGSDSADFSLDAK